MSADHINPATFAWPTNAHLIADVHRLGYLRDDDEILDPTYGPGAFWSRWRPANLHTSDLDATVDADQVADFRNLPWPDRRFDAVVFDPPYKLNGTATPDVDDRYGVGTWASWQDRHALILDGITECARVLRPGGILLVKCQDQVCGGKVRWQTIEAVNHARELGLELVDRFDKLGGRPQPAGRRQVHARRNSSTLLVFRGQR